MPHDDGPNTRRSQRSAVLIAEIDRRSRVVDRIAEQLGPYRSARNANAVRGRHPQRRARAALIGWLDALERRARDAVPHCSRKPTSEAAACSCHHDVLVQTAAPFGGSPGAIMVGYYSIQDDVVVMHDEAGIATGKRQHKGRGGSSRRSVLTDARVLAGEICITRQRSRLRVISVLLNSLPVFSSPRLNAGCFFSSGKSGKV
jgi:hypothetical protein